MMMMIVADWATVQREVGAPAGLAGGGAEERTLRHLSGNIHFPAATPICCLIQRLLQLRLCFLQVVVLGPDGDVICEQANLRATDHGGQVVDIEEEQER